MRVSVRRTTVTFTTNFYDLDEEQTIPTTATLTISYPTDGWPFNGEDLATATVDMTIAVDGEATADWDSSVSAPGIIYWHVEADTTVQAPTDGQFRLRGNLANLTYVDAESA